MKRKYYKRDTVVYKFKHEILMKDEYATANDAQKEILWEIFLISLKSIKKITKFQSKTWRYPKKELT